MSKTSLERVSWGAVRQLSEQLEYLNLPCAVINALAQTGDMAAMGIWVFLCSQSHFDEGIIMVSTQALAKQNNTSRGKIMRILERLIALGFLTKENNKDARGNKLTNSYKITLPKSLYDTLYAHIQAGQGRRCAHSARETNVTTWPLNTAQESSIAILAAQNNPPPWYEDQQDLEQEIKAAEIALNAALERARLNKSLTSKADIIPYRQKLKQLQERLKQHNHTSKDTVVHIPDRVRSGDVIADGASVFNNNIHKLEINDLNETQINTDTKTSTPLPNKPLKSLHSSKRRGYTQPEDEYYSIPYWQRTPRLHALPISAEVCLNQKLAELAYQGKVAGRVEQVKEEITWAALRFWTNSKSLSTEINRALKKVENGVWATPFNMTRPILTQEEEQAHYARHGQGVRLGLVLAKDLMG